MSKQSVKNFYDNEGWKYVGENSQDALINENLTPVATKYVSQVRLRILQNLGSGNSLLDVGSGPIQYPEYVEYSKNFKTRVCVDLSTEALTLAKANIGKHGIFIIGDYLELQTPKEAPFDGATLINVLYHVDKSKQEALVRKILGDLNPGAKLVIVYSNPRTFSAVVTKMLVKVKKFIKKILRSSTEAMLDNPIYFFRYPLSFWNQFENEAEVKILAWRTFSPALEKLLFRKYLLGELLFSLLFRMESLGSWSRLAEYPMVVLKKL